MSGCETELALELESWLGLSWFAFPLALDGAWNWKSIRETMAYARTCFASELVMPLGKFSSDGIYGVASMDKYSRCDAVRVSHEFWDENS